MKVRALALVAGLVAAATVVVAGASPASAASTATVKNTAAISIPGTGSASPYPSTINVSGLGTSLSGMKVVLRNVDHTCTKDLDVLLVGPDGTKTTLFSDNGAPAIQLDGCTDLKKDAITVDDSCVDFANAMPGGEGSRSPICIRPSDNDSVGHQGDSWPGVGNDFPALNLSTFNGKNPNGAWKLYVVDDANEGDDGSIAGGWELQLNTSNSPPVATPQVVTAYKGTPAAVTLGGTDPDGDAFTCVAGSTTAQGKGTVGGSGCSRTFTAAARATGTDSLPFALKDTSGAQSANASVVFNITNRPPTATDRTIEVGRNQRVAIALTGTDPDPGEALALTCAPTLGSAGLGTVSGSGCNVTFAAGSTNGSTSFAFSVNDGFGGLDSGSITVNVVDPQLPGCSDSDSQNARYICRVYLDLLGRAADPGGKAYWLQRVDRGESRVTIIRQYQSTIEYNRRVVDDVYLTFLQRTPDPAGQTFWANKIRKGANPDQIRTDIIGSAEYYAKSGSSPAGFAAAIYQQITRTPATQPQITLVTAQLQQGRTRQSLAAALLATREGDTATVQGVYERYLRRTPPAAEVTFWVNKLQAGVTELKIVESTISSAEYFGQS